MQKPLLGRLARLGRSWRRRAARQRAAPTTGVWVHRRRLLWYAVGTRGGHQGHHDPIASVCFFVLGFRWDMKFQKAGLQNEATRPCHFTTKIYSGILWAQFVILARKSPMHRMIGSATWFNVREIWLAARAASIQLGRFECICACAFPNRNRVFCANFLCEMW